MQLRDDKDSVRAALSSCTSHSSHDACMQRAKHINNMSCYNLLMLSKSAADVGMQQHWQLTSPSQCSTCCCS
jgi:hypothetical protein